MFKKPAMYLRDSIIFPGTEESSLLIGREDSIRAINLAMTKFDNQICIVTQTQGQNEKPGDDEIFPVGTICEIVKCLSFSDGTKKILIKGMKAFNISKISYEDETRMIEGQEFAWSTSNELMKESEKVEVINLLKKYNSSSGGKEGYDGIFHLDDFVLMASQLLAHPYSGIQMKDELEKIKRDLNYWTSMKEDQFAELNSRIGKRMKLLTTLPSSDKLQIIKNILIEETGENS